MYVVKKYIISKVDNFVCLFYGGMRKKMFA